MKMHGLQGKAIAGVVYPSPMPPFADQLKDDEIAAVINHERSSWGNKSPIVRCRGAEVDTAPRRA